MVNIFYFVEKTNLFLDFKQSKKECCDTKRCEKPAGKVISQMISHLIDGREEDNYQLQYEQEENEKKMIHYQFLHQQNQQQEQMRSQQQNINMIRNHNGMNNTMMMNQYNCNNSGNVNQIDSSFGNYYQGIEQNMHNAPNYGYVNQPQNYIQNQQQYFYQQQLQQQQQQL